MTKQTELNLNYEVEFLEFAKIRKTDNTSLKRDIFMLENDVLKSEKEFYTLQQCVFMLVIV